MMPNCTSSFDAQNRRNFLNLSGEVSFINPSKLLAKKFEQSLFFISQKNIAKDVSDKLNQPLISERHFLGKKQFSSVRLFVVVVGFVFGKSSFNVNYRKYYRCFWNGSHGN